MTAARMQRCSCGFLPIPGATHCAKCGKPIRSAASVHSLQALSKDELVRKVEGWMRHAQTSDAEVAWLRKALGGIDTEQSCAIRDAFERAEAEGAIPWEDIEKLTISAFRGALWLERTWRESSQMWERRCNQATRELADAGLLVKPPAPVLDALGEWLEHERPDGVEVTSEQADRNVRWSVVRQWFEAAGGTL